MYIVIFVIFPCQTRSKYKGEGIAFADTIAKAITKEAEGYLKGDTPEREGTVWEFNAFDSDSNPDCGVGKGDVQMAAYRGNVYYAVGRDMLNNIIFFSIAETMFTFPKEITLMDAISSYHAEDIKDTHKKQKLTPNSLLPFAAYFIASVASMLVLFTSHQEPLIRFGITLCPITAVYIYFKIAKKLRAEKIKENADYFSRLLKNTW